MQSLHTCSFQNHIPEKALSKVKLFVTPAMLGLTRSNHAGPEPHIRLNKHT